MKRWLESWRQSTNESRSEKDRETRFFAAAESGDMNTLSMLLDEGVGVETRNRRRDTALILAARGGHADAVRLLLDRGGNPNVVGSMCSAVLESALAGSEPCVRLMLEHGGDPNAKDEEHEITALMYAAQEGYLGIAQALIDSGADVNAWDWMGQTALMYASESEFPEVVALLKQAGARESPPEDWERNR